MADDSRVKRPFVRLWWLFLLCCLAVLPAAAQPVALDDQTLSVEAWPSVTVLSDPSHTLTLAQVLARRDEFVTPGGPHANLGPRQDAVWLRVPVTLAATAPRRWVLSVDYASIDELALYVPSGGSAVSASSVPIVMGRALPFSQHPLPSAWHAAAIELEPGGHHELLLRVRTHSSMVLPITLTTTQAFHAREAQAQVLQGLLAGAMLCLLLYSLSQWVSLRDSMFLSYAATIAGTGLFFVAYSGIGPQHLWGDHAVLSLIVAPLSVLVAIVGGCLFVDRVLAVRELQPWISKALKSVAALAAVLALAFVLGAIDYRSAQRLATVLGPLPMLLAIPAGWQRARRGDRIGLYMLIGWGAYALSTLTMAAVLRGWVGANFWTLHAFQLGAMFEMTMWMRVLAVRIEDLRASAQRAHLERDALRSLAHTDALTGLPNRRGLAEVLQRALPPARPERMTAVFLLDLDGFKPINDRLGHDAGDEVLVGVARRLESLLRGSDTVARLGGDEFVVVASGLASDADAQALGRKLLEGFREPFVAARQPCSVGLTIGYALAPSDGDDALSLLKRADAAMYAGKQAGRHCLMRGQPSVGLA
ncbi:GGDEF domain-containing protein [Rhizobacter sp. AJA081-3]|uniref:diguanylate cyclase n=1 Tax=Rhizobacter sp. AJA081-3 TaxID=2753607 RepID=UPI001AE0E712|nr:diguanylate cyclase [Rhizobacter sp. AJA081-3]QTN21920.1 GGDEF domain-containing protein [Rhizobacter sp. AJA081-3]